MDDSLRQFFESHFGEPVQTISALKGDGSGRSLYRLTTGTRSVIGVAGPDRQENTAFLAFSRHFRRSGLPVPEIYADDPARGIYLEEDLGDTTLFQYLSENRTRVGPSGRVVDIYERVVELLPQFQIVAGRTLNYQVCYPRPSFDRQSMAWDLNYFKYYFLRLAQIPFNEQALEDDFERLMDFLLAADRDFFLYRDFQSRNIMLKDGAPCFIDYQGGRKGALQYDIASLLFDAKADLPPDLRDTLLDRYLAAAAAFIPLAREEFLRYYYGYVYIRIMQAMGAYGLRGFYERKPHFLQSIPYAIGNLELLLRTVELPLALPELMEVFRRLVGSTYLRQFGDVELRLTVRIQSFSYRSGLPPDDKGHGGGYVFDCRALPNPGRHEQYAKLTGTDSEVIAFLEKQPAVLRFMNHVYGLIDQSVENYRSRNFTDLMVAFGCTGGRHRSIYCAELLARHLRQKHQVTVEIRHLGIETAA
ncbi:MAG TPA: RNase adapter RapZ [Methylomirabilota bacterium]|jgi:aminoglycoside/choline kinase family phosphotransferase|nr:RNase adapter RapZ [Methylomirabilota bacterium]